MCRQKSTAKKIAGKKSRAKRDAKKSAQPRKPIRNERKTRRRGQTQGYAAVNGTARSHDGGRQQGGRRQRAGRKVDAPWELAASAFAGELPRRQVRARQAHRRRSRRRSAAGHRHRAGRARHPRGGARIVADRSDRRRHHVKPQQRTEAERRARTLASLARTLTEVRKLRADEHRVKPQDDPDRPRDIEEFRRRLADDWTACPEEQMDTLLESDEAGGRSDFVTGTGKYSPTLIKSRPLSRPTATPGTPG